MKAFSKEHIAEISTRYGSYPDHRRPEIYRIATYAQYEPMRDQIRRWVGDFIPEAEQGKFVETLSRDEHFRAFYNELLVARKLTQLGYEIAYERKLGKSRTPDWFVSTQDSSTQFYVEVFTPQVPNDIVRLEGQQKDLSARIESRMLGYGISIYAGRKCSPPDTKRAKKLVNRVAAWLKMENPSEGDSICISPDTLDHIIDDLDCFWAGLKFVVRETNLSSHSSWCLPPMELYDISVKRLKEGIEKKTKKYAKALLQMSIPYVICVVPSESMFVHADIEEVLRGDIEIAIFPSNNGNYLSYPHHKKNGIFSRRDDEYLTLSAVIWFQELYSWNPETNKDIYQSIRVFENPRALYPLPKEALQFDQI